jgi:hypothetical protein
LVERRDRQTRDSPPGERDSAFEDDLQLHLFPARFDKGADAVAVRDDLARELERGLGDPAQRGIAHRRAQRPIPFPTRAKKIDVRRLAVFPESQHDPGAAAEVALGTREKIRVQGTQHRQHRAVARAHGARH